MKKRPLSIVIIAVFYLFEPIGNLIQAAYINDLPLIGQNSILHHLIWSDWIVLSLFPVVAFGVYTVRKWGWFLFVGFSVLLISYNFYVYFFLNPNYKLHTVILFIIFVTIISAVFFRKHVYAPYFNPRLRWWEVASRYRIALDAKIIAGDSPVACRLLDISETGCFVNYDGALEAGENVWMSIKCAGDEIKCLGKVVRKSAAPGCSGYGIWFQTVSRETRLKIKALIRTLEAHGGKDRTESISATSLPDGILEKRRSFFENMHFRVTGI
ncbi:MAG: PilZ domain-containing protein [Desulfobacteraceae bacterium]|nr:MAG: PilZ domain-containing protein [Desulfobacteraceae bacterium]